MPLRPVLRTTNLALVESTRFALESEEIPAVTSNTFAAGLPFNLVTVAVLRDADFGRAVALVGELQRDTVDTDDLRPGPRRRLHRFAAWVVVLMALVGFYVLVA